MTKNKLRRMAYAEAAGILIKAASAVDLDPDLTPEDEAWVREFLLNNIARILTGRSKGA